MTKNKNFHIHGDNIVECERVLKYIEFALNGESEGPFGASFAPTYKISYDGGEYSFTFFPGFGHWDKDINTYISECGGILRESADVVITSVDNSKEKPLLAVEFCSALQAGNQAWQRSGRGYSFANAKIPYLYVVELGGIELDKNRKSKAPRFPNPAVPLSYITYSKKSGSIVLPVYIRNKNIGSDLTEKYDKVFGDNLLKKLFKSIVTEEKFPENIRDALIEKIWAFISIKTKKKVECLKADNTMFSVKFSKCISMGITKRLEELKKFCEENGKSIGCKNDMPPFCILDAKQRKIFKEKLETQYKKNLSDAHKNWLSSDKPIAIVWMAGFKPKGDDARPDRGLVPLVRMLLGDEFDILTIIYGPAPECAIKLLNAGTQQALADKNGLWESVLKLSDLIIVDNNKIQCANNHVFLGVKKQENPKKISEFSISTIPSTYNENDVDTVVHTVFTRLFPYDKIYEGMCNPPGGDWSGMSIIDNNKNFSWLSLPRVSGNNTKRPDHVIEFQAKIEKLCEYNLLIIESKQYISNILKENKKNGKIGDRLINYMNNLIKEPASVVFEDSSWKQNSNGEKVCTEKFSYLSAIATLYKENDVEKIGGYADIFIGVQPIDGGAKSKVYFKSLGENGDSLIKFIDDNINKSSELYEIEIIYQYKGSKDF